MAWTVGRVDAVGSPGWSASEMRTVPARTRTRLPFFLFGLLVWKARVEKHKYRLIWRPFVFLGSRRRRGAKGVWDEGEAEVWGHGGRSSSRVSRRRQEAEERESGMEAGPRCGLTSSNKAAAVERGRGERRR
jgi:hypothetical protein